MDYVPVLFGLIVPIDHVTVVAVLVVISTEAGCHIRHVLQTQLLPFAGIYDQCSVAVGKLICEVSCFQLSLIEDVYVEDDGSIIRANQLGLCDSGYGFPSHIPVL